MTAKTNNLRQGVIALLNPASRFMRKLLRRPEPADEAKALAVQAMAARRAGDWPTAAGIWRRAIALSPRNAAWRFRAVEASARAGLADEAAAWARTATDDTPAKSEPVLYAAAALIDAGRLAEATAILQLVSGADANRGWALALRAQLKQAAGDIETALRLADEAAAAPDLNGKAARVLKRTRLLSVRRPAPKVAPEPPEEPAADFIPDTAPEPTPAPIPESVVEPVVEDVPEVVEAAPEAPSAPPEVEDLDRLAALFRRVDIPHELRAAAPVFEDSAPARDDSQTDALLAEAETALAAGDAETARVRLKRAVARAPQSWRAAYALARASQSLGDEEASLAWLRTTVRLDPSAQRPRRELARRLMRPGLFDQAVREWQILYALQGGDEPLIQVARALQRLDAHEAAIQAFDLLAEMQPRNMEARVGKARSSQALGLPSAAEAWAGVLDLDPTAEEAAVLLARALRERGDHAGAIAVIDRAMGHNQSSDRLRLQKARMLVAAGEPAEAIAVLRALCDEQPDNVDRQVELGRAMRASADWTAVQPVWRRVIELAPLNAEAHRGLADAYEKAGDPASALALWKSCRETGLLEWEAFIYAARIQHRMGLREDAAQTYLAATERYPEEVRVLGEAANYLGRTRATLNEAQIVADQWVALAPQSPEAFVCRGGILSRLGRHEDGEADIETALRVAPGSVPALAAKTRRLYAEQNWAAAEAFAQVWRRASGAAPDASEILAKCLSNQGRFEEAEALYKDQRLANPNDTRAIMMVAELCRRDRKLDEAVALWREVIAIEPASVAAWTEMVAALANADHEAEALRVFEEAKLALGDGPESLLPLAIMMDRARFVDRAGKAYEQANAVDVRKAEAAHMYGRFLAREGRLSQALRYLNEAREADPLSFELALEVIDVIEGLQLLGHADPVKVLKGPDLGSIMPEKLFDLVVTAALKVPIYEPIKGRVALVTQALGPGGAERQLAATARGLAEHGGLESVFLSCLPLDPVSQRDFHAASIRDAGVPIHEATAEAIAASHQDALVREHQHLLKRLPQDMGPVGWWLAQFREMRPEVVHAWQDMTCLAVCVAAILAGVPRVVLGTRSVRPDNPRRRLRRWMQHAYKDLLRVPTVQMINNSRAGGADYAEWLGLPAEQVKVVYNGLAFESLKRDADPATRTRIREELGVPLGAPLIGGVFRMSEEKRPMLWMETAGLVAKARPDAHFVVCGAGPFYEEMADYAKAQGFGDRMHLPGVQSRIGGWFSAMDTVLLTSRHEGLPNVLIEAQSLGVPVVVPDVGGAAETLINGETGFAIPKATAADMAEKIVFILEDETWRAKAHAAAESFIRERFSMERMVDATLEVYFGEAVARVEPKPSARPKAKPRAVKAKSEPPGQPIPEAKPEPATKPKPQSGAKSGAKSRSKAKPKARPNPAGKPAAKRS